MKSIFSVLILFVFTSNFAQDSFECDANTPGQIITLTNIQDIKCDEAGCCAGTTFIATCAVDEECKIECTGDNGACDGASFTMNNVEEIICDKPNGCRGATMVITDPLDDFSLQCKDENSCEALDLTVTISASNTNTDSNGIFCEKENSCLNAQITVQNDNPSTIFNIETLKCEPANSCDGLILDLDNGVGTVSLEECECGDEGGCTNIAQGFEECFNAENVEDLECKNRDCAGRTIIITNPENEFELECADDLGCEDTEVIIIINDNAEDAPITEIKGYKCGGDMSCAGITVTVVNNQSNGVVINIEKIECDGDDACPGAIFDYEGPVGSVIVEEVVCGGDNSCGGCQVENSNGVLVNCDQL